MNIDTNFSIPDHAQENTHEVTSSSGMSYGVIADTFLRTYSSGPDTYSPRGTLHSMASPEKLSGFYPESVHDAQNLMLSTETPAPSETQFPSSTSTSLFPTPQFRNEVFNFGTVTQEPFRFNLNVSQRFTSIPRTVPERWIEAPKAVVSFASSSSTPFTTPSPPVIPLQHLTNKRKRKAIGDGNLPVQRKQKIPRVDARDGENQKAAVYKCILSSCGKNGYETKSKRSYERHCGTKEHLGLDSAQTKLVCNVCNKTYTRSDAVTRHKNKSHPQ